MIFTGIVKYTRYTKSYYLVVIKDFDVDLSIHTYSPFNFYGIALLLHLYFIQQGSLTMTKPPYILIKTWLEIYLSNNTQEDKKARDAVEKLIFKYFNSVYEAEMYLFKLEQAK